MSFAKLLEDLDALSGSIAGTDDITKSMAADGDDDGADADGAAAEGDADGAADDAAIADAAAEGEDAGAAADADGDDDSFGKSFSYTDAEGNEQEGFDATDFLKSLHTRVENNEVSTLAALGQMTDLVKSMSGQLGSLATQVKQLGSQGRGRKTTVTVAEPIVAADMAKSDPADGGITAKDFMAKAMTAFEGGKLSGGEVARCESYINRGLDVPANIKAKVLG